MKALLFTALFLSSTFTFAASYNCENKVNRERTEFAHIESWPGYNIQTSFQECSEDGNVGVCNMGPLEEIANIHQVCYREFMTESMCQTQELASSQGKVTLTITCEDGPGTNTVLNFTMNARGKGTIECSEEGVVKKTWNVGTCKAD